MHYEIVKVIDRHTLLDHQVRRHAFRPPEGQRLANGIYAALWPSEDVDPAYDAGAVYVGPFPSWIKARQFVHDAWPDLVAGLSRCAGSLPQMPLEYR